MLTKADNNQLPRNYSRRDAKEKPPRHRAAVRFVADRVFIVVVASCSEDLAARHSWRLSQSLWIAGNQ